MRIFNSFKLLIIFIFFLLMVSCSTAFPDIFLYPISGSWKISNKIDNSCMFEKREMNWKTKYFIPYLLNENQFRDILSETENISYRDDNYFEKNTNLACTYKNYLLIENYEENLDSLLNNFSITLENYSLYYSETFKYLYYYDEMIFKTSAIKIDFFSNPKRASRLKYGKKIELFNSNTDIMTERMFIIFCSKKRIDILNLSLISKENKNHYSTYSIFSDCIN